MSDVTPWLLAAAIGLSLLVLCIGIGVMLYRLPRATPKGPPAAFDARQLTDAQVLALWTDLATEARQRGLGAPHD